MIVKLGLPNNDFFSGEVLDLIWSNSKHETKFDIPSKTPRYVDLCAADHHPESLGLMLCAKGSVAQLKDANLNGQTSLDICVAAENAATIKKTVRVQFNGSATSLQIVM